MGMWRENSASVAIRASEDSLLQPREHEFLLET